VLLEQLDGGERGRRRNQRRAALHAVAPFLDGLDDRGVRGGPADAELLEPLHQGGLGEARRRLRLVPDGLERRLKSDPLALGHRREAALLVLELGVRIVRPFDVGSKESGERDDLAGGGELGVAARRARPAEPHLDALADGIRHLRRDGALPDEVVESRLVLSHLPGDDVRGCGTSRRSGGSPRGPPGRSSPSTSSGGAGRAGTRRRTWRPPVTAPRPPPPPTGPCCRCACR
jgi:hypothetical protein